MSRFDLPGPLLRSKWYRRLPRFLGKSRNDVGRDEIERRASRLCTCNAEYTRVCEMHLISLLNIRRGKQYYGIRAAYGHIKQCKPIIKATIGSFQAWMNSGRVCEECVASNCRLRGNILRGRHTDTPRLVCFASARLNDKVTAIKAAATVDQ